MSTDFNVNAELRSDTGKGASRRLRRAGLVPGIIYGAHQDPTMITLKHNELIQHLEQETFYSSILDIKMGGKTEKAVIKDLQRHPAKPFIQHIDFQRIDAKETIKVHAPIHFIGENVAPGVKAGGIVGHNMTDIEISCLPKDLPEFIEVDVSALEIGDSLHLSDITLPKGVELAHAADAGQTVVAIHGKGGGSDEEEAAEGEEETE